MALNIPKVITVDFETKAIQNRPEYPPEPVGVAIKWPGEPGEYGAWGHPSANNCTRDDAVRELNRVWDSGLPVLCHHGKFDIAVATEKLGFPMLPWERIHDTMFLAFLADPHARSLDLKGLAHHVLGWAPGERDAVAEWIMARKKDLPKLPNKKGELKAPTLSTAGAWISFVPGDIVAPYAIGDVDRTEGLFNYWWPIVQAEGMGAAYDRERRLLPILLENERVGMRTDVEALANDVEGYSEELRHAEDWLRHTLKASGLNFDADRDVANVLLERGIVPKENWTLTASGMLCVKKDVLLPEHYSGPQGAEVASALGYRNRLTTCLNFFMRPWLHQASQRNGYISTNWNQTKGEKGGTRTGRPSTANPNFLNISKTWDGRDDGYVHPVFLGVEPLPLVRNYILPDEGHTFLHRDFDGQELRVFAHFECGALQQEYLKDPATDPHKFVGAELMRVVGRELDRTKVKTLNFQGLYGGGVPALQAKLRCSASEAKELKKFHDQALPGRKDLNEAIKWITTRGEPIRTWGGRLYFPEPKRMVDGRMRDFTYKRINYLIQGSAADLTKEALIVWHSCKPRARFLVTVYDELDISAPTEIAREEMALLKEVMEHPRLDVPMRSSGKAGKSWGGAVKYID